MKVALWGPGRTAVGCGSATTSASEDLAKHRWHWTLDETNPERMSQRAYAKLVGRSDSVIGAMVRAYADSLVAPRGAHVPFAEQIQRAKVSTEKEQATDAVAAARGVTYNTARKADKEVQAVRREATEKAEDTGQEYAKVVKQVAKDRASGPAPA